jgi:hypothetical protein
MAYPISTLPNTNAPDANYPLGSAKNVSTPAATDGTPIETNVYNDIQGLLQRLLVEAGITPSGVSDTVVASDYYDSLVAILYREFGAGSLRSFATVAAMKAATDLSVGDLVITQEYISGQNKGGAIYVVVAPGIGTDDGGTYLTLAGPSNYQAKLIPGRWVTSSQFGATDAADNTTKIQALLDSAFPNVHIDNASTISGAGLSLSRKARICIGKTLSYTGSGTCLTLTTGADDSVVDFAAHGVLVGDNVTATQKGIVITGIDNAIVRDGRISLFLNAGIELVAATYNKITNMNLAGIGAGAANAGIHLSGASTLHNTINDCIFDSNAVAILIAGALHNEVRNITADHCTIAGVYLSSAAKYNLIADARCAVSQGVAYAGVYVEGDCIYNTFMRPSCYSGLGNGISIKNLSTAQPLGNKLVAPFCSGNAKNGIFLQQCLAHDIVSPNLSANTEDGLQTVDCEDSKVMGGYISGNTINGIRHKSSLRTLENGVTITDNGGRGVLIDDTGSLTPESFRNINCHYEGNGSQAWQTSGSGLQDAKINNATGFVTDNGGIASVTFTAGAGQIAHGLSLAPNTVNSHFSFVSQVSGLIFAVTSVDATYIYLNCVNHAGTAYNSIAGVYWEAHLH